MTAVHILAIDLAKRSFQVCATDRGGVFRSAVASNNGSGNGLIGFGAGPRCADVLRAKTPSAASRFGFLVEETGAVFLTASILLIWVYCFAGGASSP